MIIGNGMMARAFMPRYAGDPDVTVFASGVSNSGERSPEAFAREAALLERAVAAGTRLVYFGTCSVADPDRAATPYVRHKLAMEALAARAPRHVVFRLPQVVGRTPNPHTLVNFLRAHIASGERFPVWRHAWRNVIDVDDVARIATAMLDEGGGDGRVIVVANPKPVRVLDLVAILERLLDRRANCDIVERGDWYPIDASETMAVAKRIGVDFGADYVARTLGKYHGER